MQWNNDSVNGSRASSCPASLLASGLSQQSPVTVLVGPSDVHDQSHYNRDHLLMKCNGCLILTIATAFSKSHGKQ